MATMYGQGLVYRENITDVAKSGHFVWNFSIFLKISVFFQKNDFQKIDFPKAIFPFPSG
jgi:hypothetical protein